MSQTLSGLHLLLCHEAIFRGSYGINGWLNSGNCCCTCGGYTPPETVLASLLLLGVWGSSIGQPCLFLGWGTKTMVCHAINFIFNLILQLKMHFSIVYCMWCVYCGLVGNAMYMLMTCCQQTKMSKIQKLCWSCWNLLLESCCVEGKPEDDLEKKSALSIFLMHFELFGIKG